RRSRGRLPLFALKERDEGKTEKQHDRQSPPGIFGNRRPARLVAVVTLICCINVRIAGPGRTAVVIPDETQPDAGSRALGGGCPPAVVRAPGPGRSRPDAEKNEERPTRKAKTIWSEHKIL